MSAKLKALSAISAAILPLTFCLPVYAASSDGTAQVTNFLQNVITILASFGGLICTIMVIYGGYLYITSGGDLQKHERAKSTLKNAAIGLIIILGAAALVSMVAAAAKAFGA